MTLQKPPPYRGWAHLMAATGYSLAGFRRLWREAAFRQELLGGVIGLVILWIAGAPILSLVVMAVLLLMLLAVEALNTSIEVLVDHLSPEWSAFAKDAKDLGSAAVFLLVCANAVWFLGSLVMAVTD
jgi:diacylglycerol kinase (ATP)